MNSLCSNFYMKWWQATVTPIATDRHSLFSYVNLNQLEK